MYKLNTMFLKYFVFLFLAFYYVLALEESEPACYSRWDYEYKTIRQLAKMENKQEELEEVVEKQNEVIDAQQRLIDKLSDKVNPRTVFTRWGRKVCPDSASMVYKGYTAGKHYNHKGSGSDTICLPEEPTWSKYSDGNSGFGRAYIYGTEIHIEEPNSIFSSAVHHQNLPCAVCLSPRSTTLMIPGRTECTDGWTEEYTGYLVASYRDHPGAHNYICLDFQPDFIPNGNKDDSEHILYLVETQCGSLPCPPYVQGRELACAVCSK